MSFVDTGLDIRLERLLNDVAPQEAFAAWLDAEGRRSWYTPQEGWTVEAESDLRVGGKWRAVFGPTSDEMYSEEGEYTEIDPPHRIAYTNTFTFPDGRTFTTLNVISFTAVDDGTLLVCEDKGYPDEQQRDGHQQGWPSFLDMFEKYVTSR